MKYESRICLSTPKKWNFCLVQVFNLWKNLKASPFNLKQDFYYAHCEWKYFKNPNLAVRKGKMCLFLQLLIRKVSCSLHYSENAAVPELQHFTSARWAKLLVILFQNAEIFWPHETNFIYATDSKQILKSYVLLLASNYSTESQGWNNSVKTAVQSTQMALLSSFPINL